MEYHDIPNYIRKDLEKEMRWHGLPEEGKKEARIRIAAIYAKTFNEVNPTPAMLRMAHTWMKFAQFWQWITSFFRI